jgi:hypothetical protein
MLHWSPEQVTFEVQLSTPLQMICALDALLVTAPLQAESAQVT